MSISTHRQILFWSENAYKTSLQRSRIRLFILPHSSRYYQFVKGPVSHKLHWNKESHLTTMYYWFLPALTSVLSVSPTHSLHVLQPWTWKLIKDARWLGSQTAKSTKDNLEISRGLKQVTTPNFSILSLQQDKFNSEQPMRQSQEQSSLHKMKLALKSYPCSFSGILSRQPFF